MSHARELFAAVVLVSVPVTAPVHAAIIPLGDSGWQAEVDDSFIDDDLLSIGVESVTQDALIITKTAEFRQGPTNGIFPSIPITFVQIDPDAVAHIVIEGETIRNETGVDWTDFHFTLLDHGDAVFDPAATFGSGGPDPIGFDVAPFSQAMFSSDNEALDVFDGTVPNGTTWSPGGGSSGGQLWIDVTPGSGTPEDPFAVFTLKERPTPEPGTLLVLACAAPWLLIRRRPPTGSRGR